MFKYWSNVFAMLGVALLATAFFRPAYWQTGIVTGIIFIFIGAWFYGLSSLLKRGK